MGVFEAYSKYYNLLYRDKDYFSEVEYIDELIRKHQSLVSDRILDVGCGTGTHDFLLAEKGYKLTGVDRAEDMIKVANSRASSAKDGIEFFLGDAVDFDLSKKFDVVVSLFHVASYLNSNDALDTCFRNIHRHLEDRGLFIFDFWYGPAVLSDMPEVRVKEMEDEEVYISRTSTPVMHVNKNVVDVNFDITITDKKTGEVETLKETHPMRYLFVPEMEYFLSQTGFKVLDYYKWQSCDEQPGLDNWNACIVAEKLS